MKNCINQLNEWLAEYSQLSESETLATAHYVASEATLTSLSTAAKVELNTLVYSKQSGQRITRQLHQWQHELTLLLNQLDNVQLHQDLKEMLTSAVLALCSHLEHHYPKYFNDSGAMPNCLANEMSKQILQELTLLQAAMKQRKVSAPLAAIVLQTFEQLKATAGLSYKQWRYWQAVLANLIKFCRDIANQELQYLLQEHLIYLRFDSVPLYHFLKEQLKTQLDTCYQLDQQYDLLCELKKRLLQQQEQQDYSLQQLGLGLRELLLDFVLAELAYLQRRQITKEMYSPPLLEQYRVSVGISVDSLAYLLKLSIAVGLVNASPKSTFLHFIAQHFQTPGIGEAKISVNSLNAKYKQVVQHTAVKVRLLLKRMIKQIETEFDLT